MLLMRHPPCYPVSCETSSSDIIIINLLKAVCRSRASKTKFARRNKTALGPLGQAETSLKIENFMALLVTM